MLVRSHPLRLIVLAIAGLTAGGASLGCRQALIAPQPAISIESIPSDVSVASRSTTYRVTVENLTPARGGGASQVLSPSLVVVHDEDFDLFEVGKRANQAVIDVAEDAIGATGVRMFSGRRHVGFVGFLGAPIPPGTRQSFEVTAPRRFGRLSLATMLVNTNDGFTGLHGVRLRAGPSTYMTRAYDAGSEVNDQLHASIPGPCCGDTGRHGTDESKRIKHHPGILAGVGDLDPAQWGWPTDQPVAKITVERVR